MPGHGGPAHVDLLQQRKQPLGAERQGAQYRQRPREPALPPEMIAASAAISTMPRPSITNLGAELMKLILARAS